MSGPASLFRQSITFTSVTGRDSHGDPVLAANATAPARVQPMRRMTRTAAGNEVMSTHVVYTAAPITLRSRVWFPGADTAELDDARAPIGVDEHVDGSGATIYRKVWF